VGTLCSNESEFTESRLRVLEQRNCAVNQYLVKDLNEYDAHNLLWDLFNKRASSFDLIVKVDADTILNRDDIFQKVHSRLLTTNLDGVQLSLLDYFSQQSIFGMGFFLPRVKFSISQNRLFADRAINREAFKIGQNQDIDILEDIGFHCRYPNDEQSYRYGLHRWKKKQYNLISSVIENWNRERDTARGWALVGAISAQKKRRISVDYGGKDFQTLRDSFNSRGKFESWLASNLPSLSSKINC